MLTSGDGARDSSDSIQFSYTQHPADELEPAPLIDSDRPGYREGYRDAALRHLFIINRLFIFLFEANPRNVAMWQVALALGAGMCEGKSMTKVGEMCGVTRACISKGARTFCEINELPPSFYMKTEEAVDKAKQARNKQLL